jgi:hypothetical protein
MRFLAEQHLAMAKLLREKAASRLDIERPKWIKKSNSLLVCAALAAKERGGLSFCGFDRDSLTPDWNAIDYQIAQLKPPYVNAPSLVPDCAVR